MRTEDPINVGFDCATGQAVTVDQDTYGHWRAKSLRGDHSLICLYCHQTGIDIPLVVCFKVGGRKRMYFRHPPGTARGGHSPETVWHVDGKLLITAWARMQQTVSHVETECWTADRVRRADVMVTLTCGTRIAVELQSRALTDGDWLLRHQDYAQRGIIDVWLWHPSIERPGILLQHQADLWYLDVTEALLGIPIGQPHEQRQGRKPATAARLRAPHYPPCLDDRTVRRWHPLSESTLHAGGLQLPSTLAAELASAPRQLHRLSPRTLPPRIDCGATPAMTRTRSDKPYDHTGQQPVDELYEPPPDDFLHQLREYLQAEPLATATVRFDGRSAHLANGFPVYAGDHLIGVACPRPDSATDWSHLAGLRVFVAPNQTRWIGRAAPLGTKLKIIDYGARGST